MPYTARQDEELALGYMMIAIGAQSRGRDQRDAIWSNRYFTRGRRIAFEGMLQDPTVNLAALFLLMAFYMFGACRRNAAFMYIGVASKAAIVLGLHAPGEYRNATKQETDRRSVFFFLERFRYIYKLAAS